MIRQTSLPKPANIPVPTPGFALEELDDELLLFSPQDGRLLELNATAALVWQLCDGARSLAEITDLLSAAYPEEGTSIENDVSRILANLANLGAITWK